MDSWSCNAERIEMMMKGPRILTIGITLSCFLACSGCWTSVSETRAVFERCIRASSACSTVKVRGTVKAFLSDGRHSESSFEGAESRAQDGELDARFVASSNLLNGRHEDFAVYYQNGYEYINISGDWWKSKAAPPRHFIELQKYARNLKMVSQSEDSCVIECELSSQYVCEVFGLDPNAKSDGSEIEYGQFADDSQVAVRMTISKTDDLMARLTQRTQMPSALGGHDLDMIQTTDYYDYDSTVDVTLPEAAIDAKTVNRQGILFPFIQGYTPE